MLSLLAICRVAVFAPELTGVNRTVKVVLLFVFSRIVGLVVTVNIVEFVPLMVMPKPVRAAVPRFVMVKVRLALVPTITEPKSRLLTPLVRNVPRGC